jgi:hypothetical protein
MAIEDSEDGDWEMRMDKEIMDSDERILHI